MSSGFQLELHLGRLCYSKISTHTRERRGSCIKHHQASLEVSLSTPVQLEILCFLLKVLGRNTLSITRKSPSSFMWIWFRLRWKRGNKNPPCLFVYKIQCVPCHSFYYWNLMIWGYFLHPKRLPRMLLQGHVIFTLCDSLKSL